MVTRNYIPEKAERPNSVLAFLSMFPALTAIVFSATGHVFLYVNDINGSRSFFLIGFVAAVIALASGIIALLIPRTKKILPLFVVFLGLASIVLSYVNTPYLSADVRYWISSVLPF